MLQPHVGNPCRPSSASSFKNLVAGSVTWRLSLFHEERNEETGLMSITMKRGLLMISLRLKRSATFPMSGMNCAKYAKATGQTSTGDSPTKTSIAFAMRRPCSQAVPDTQVPVYL